MKAIIENFADLKRITVFNSKGNQIYIADYNNQDLEDFISDNPNINLEYK